MRVTAALADSPVLVSGRNTKIATTPGLFLVVGIMDTIGCHSSVFMLLPDTRNDRNHSDRY